MAGPLYFFAQDYGVDFTGNEALATTVANSDGLDRCTADAAAVGGIVYLHPGTVVLARTWVIHNAYITVQGSGGSALYGGNDTRPSASNSLGIVGYFRGVGTILTSPQDGTANWPLVIWYCDKQSTGILPSGVYASMRDVAILGFNPGSPNYEPHIVFTIDPSGLTNDGVLTTVHYNSPSLLELREGQHVYIVAGTPDSPYNGFWGPILQVFPGLPGQFTYLHHTASGAPLPPDGGGLVLLGPKLLRDSNNNYTTTPYLCTIRNLAPAVVGLPHPGLQALSTTVTVQIVNGLQTVTTVKPWEFAINDQLIINQGQSDQETVTVTDGSNIGSFTAHFASSHAISATVTGSTKVTVDYTRSNGLYGGYVTIVGAADPAYNGTFGPINLTRIGQNQFNYSQIVPVGQQIPGHSGGGFVCRAGGAEVAPTPPYLVQPTQHGVVVDNVALNMSNVTIAACMGHGLFLRDVTGGNFENINIYASAGSNIWLDGRPYPYWPFQPMETLGPGTPGLSNDGTVTTVNTNGGVALTSGMYVQIKGATEPAYNNVWGPITVTGRTQFIYSQVPDHHLGSDGNAFINPPFFPDHGPTIAVPTAVPPGLCNNGTVTTVNTTVPHGLFSGLFVKISGAANSAYNNLLAGPITVTSSTQFTFPTSPPSGPIPDSGGGLVLPDLEGSRSPYANTFRSANLDDCAGTALCFASDSGYNTFFAVDIENASGYAVDFSGGYYGSTKHCSFNDIFGIHEEACGASVRFQDDSGGTTNGTGAKGNVLWLSNFNDFDPNGFSDGTAKPGGIQNSLIGATSVDAIQASGQNIKPNTLDPGGMNFSVLPRWGAMALSRSVLSYPNPDPNTDLAHDPGKLDFALHSGIVDVTLTNDVTFTFVAAEDGQVIHLILRQGGGGSQNVNWPSNVAWRDGVAPMLRTAVNAYDHFVFFYSKDDKKFYELSG